MLFLVYHITSLFCPLKIEFLPKVSQEYINILYKYLQRSWSLKFYRVTNLFPFTVSMFLFFRWFAIFPTFHAKFSQRTMAARLLENSANLVEEFSSFLKLITRKLSSSPFRWTNHYSSISHKAVSTRYTRRRIDKKPA